MIHVSTDQAALVLRSDLRPDQEYHIPIDLVPMLLAPILSDLLAEERLQSYDKGLQAGREQARREAEQAQRRAEIAEIAAESMLAGLACLELAA